LDQGRSLKRVVGALLVLASCRSSRGERSAPPGPAWLRERGREEAVLGARSSTFHEFRYADRLEASGITFENRIVDDAGKAYKKVHYDHGTGLCAADVDGDGLPDLYFVTQLGPNELWKNLGGGRFANVTDEAGLTMPDAVAAGCRPQGMKPDEELAYDFCDELFRTHGVSEVTYRRAIAQLGERGVIDLLGLVGYFTTVSMVMNVAHTPPPEDQSVAALAPFPP